MKILFGQSYYLRFDPKLWDAMQPYPPLGTLYAASYLRSRGYEVALFDAMLAESEHEWATVLDRYQPRYAILYEDNFNYLSKMCLLRMRTAAFSMIAMAKARGCIVILCGADATDHASTYLAHGADYVLLGEGEETLAEVLDHLEKRPSIPFSRILGLAWKDEYGQEKSTSRRPDITSLDALPFPAWDLIDLPRYQRVWRARHGYFSMNMVTTRGCPYHCNWCAKPIWGQRYNSRSPENVVAELALARERYHPDHLWFADDILGLKPGWLPRFAELIEAHGVRVPFKCLSRADLLLREGEIDALGRAGCHSVWIGAESGSQKILDTMEKGTRVEQIQQACTRLHAVGIRVGFFLQFGYPGETWDDIHLTLKMIRECMPDEIGISVSYPLPGTKFHERVRAELVEKTNWEDSDDLALLYHGPYSQEFYRVLYQRVHREFHLRRSLAALKHDIPRPSHWRPHHLRLAASVPYHWTLMMKARHRLQKLRSGVEPGNIHK